MNAPCMNCSDRCVNCHSNCNIYKTWKAEHDEKEQKIREAKQKEYYANGRYKKRIQFAM